MIDVEEFRDLVRRLEESVGGEKVGVVSLGLGGGGGGGAFFFVFLGSVWIFFIF
jgi:hypothetical protein